MKEENKKDLKNRDKTVKDKKEKDQQMKSQFRASFPTSNKN